MSSRVVIYEPACTEDRPLTESLAGQGFVLVPCSDARTVLEEVVQGHADALVFALCDPKDTGDELGLLRLVRRASADLPLVLLARDDSLAVRRQLQYFNPIYYAVWPPDPIELREAVCAAVLKTSKHRVVSSAKRAV